MRLLNRHSVVVKRKVSEDGYYNDDGDRVASQDIVEVNCKGNTQSYIKGSVNFNTTTASAVYTRPPDTTLPITTEAVSKSDDEAMTAGT